MRVPAADGAILQLSASKLKPALSPAPLAPFTVRYLDARTACALIRHPDHVLGVVGFGADCRPDFLSDTCPFVAAPLVPAAGGPIFEVWSAATSCRSVAVGPVTGASTDDLVFGTVTIDEAASPSLEGAADAAYHAIFDFLDATGFIAPVRFWNYLTAITEDDNGLERYRRFNIGRHEAFSKRLRQSLPPAASGVGGLLGASVIYFLAAREPAQPVENPRQVSAYRYPPAYGPSSPSFSRASIFALAESETLFVSGTASIVGHETLHLGDLDGQISETIENLRAVIGAAEAAAAAPLGDSWAFKVYLHDPEYREAVDRAIAAAFGCETQRLYLRGDMCRSELMVEIEACRHFASDPDAW